MVIITNTLPTQIRKVAPSYLAGTKMGLAMDVISKFMFCHLYRTTMGFMQTLQKNIVGDGLG
jgi:hypothetical protein